MRIASIGVGFTALAGASPGVAVKGSAVRRWAEAGRHRAATNHMFDNMKAPDSLWRAAARSLDRVGRATTTRKVRPTIQTMCATAFQLHGAVASLACVMCSWSIHTPAEITCMLEGIKAAKAPQNKSPTGCSRKRLVYDRRFVILVKGGPKWAPNSNMK